MLSFALINETANDCMRQQQQQQQQLTKQVDNWPMADVVKPPAYITGRSSEECRGWWRMAEGMFKIMYVSPNIQRRCAHEIGPKAMATVWPFGPCIDRAMLGESESVRKASCVVNGVVMGLDDVIAIGLGCVAENKPTAMHSWMHVWKVGNRECVDLCTM